ncbi:MAG: DUF1302 family protein [Halioglobus sp.]
MRNLFTRLIITGLLLKGLSFASADNFVVKEVQGLYNGRLSYGSLYRLQDTDPDLVAIASGGNYPSANTDDGNLNYGKGLVSNSVRASGEVAVSWGNFGAYLRGAAFYDFEGQSNSPGRTEFDNDAEKLVGSDVDLRESYVNLRLSPGGMPLVFRVGQQILNWSETTFVRDGLDVINPINLVTALQPTSTREDLRTPQRMVWAAANITETVSVEAYYQYEWEPITLPPVGWAFSPIDALGGEGLQSWMYGNGEISDLGTDLDQRFGLPADTLGFDQDFQRLPGVNRDTPSDTGQYGIAVIGLLPDSNATKVGVHYLRYHSRFPLLMARTGNAAAVAATAEPFVAARASALESVYLDEGLDPAEAALLGRDAAEQLTVSNYANQASFFATYPEDIEAFGLTFSTSTTGTGTLISGEFSHHRDFPFQVAFDPLLQAVFSPVLFDPELGDTPLGDFGPGQVIGGIEKIDRSLATLEAAQVFRGRLWADQVLISADLAWAGIHGGPGNDEPPLTSSDKNSWGYRTQIAASYSGLFGGINIVPYLGFAHDFDGTTPAPLGTFLEDRKTVVLGLRASYINRITTEMRYTRFTGGGRANQLRDRDYLRFQVSYYL